MFCGLPVSVAAEPRLLATATPTRLGAAGDRAPNAGPEPMIDAPDGRIEAHSGTLSKRIFTPAPPRVGSGRALAFIVL